MEKILSSLRHKTTFIQQPLSSTLISTQPLFISLLLAEEVIESCNERLGISDQKLNGLEETMSQHEYDNRPKGNPLDLDFLVTTRTLNHISKRVGVDVLRLESVVLVLEKIQQWKKQIVTHSQRIHNDAEKAIVAEETSNDFHMAEEETSFLIDPCRIYISRAQYTEKRVRTLMQVVKFPLPISSDSILSNSGLPIHGSKGR
jgi:hypothetical protein